MTARPPQAVLLDLDGTVVSGEQFIDGAAVGVDRLRAAGLPVLFLTNRATHTAAAHAATLRAGGVDATAADVLTSAGITAAALAPGEGPALVLGSDPLRAALDDAGIEVLTDPEPRGVEVVVASVAPDIDVEQLTAATRAIDAGARFVATNPDGARPTPRGPRPETGAISAALTAATAAEPTVLGKPHPGAAEAAVERLRHASDAPSSLEPSQCLLVGDNPETDVALGRAVGATTVLVDGEGSIESEDGWTESEDRWTEPEDRWTESERGRIKYGDGRTNSVDESTEFDDDTQASAADPTPDFRVESLAAIPPVLEALGCA